MDDHQIIELFFQRSEQAIAEVSAKYGQWLYLQSLNITQCESDAQECVNDTYFDAWNRIPPHRPERLFAFLSKILRHKSLDLCEKNRAQKRSGVLVELSRELEVCIPSPVDTESAVDYRLLQAAINAFLRTLDDRNQYIFVRRYFYLDPIETIAKATGKSQSGVTASLHRTRQKLKTYLIKEGFSL